MGDIIINGAITLVGPLSICAHNLDDYNGFPIMSRGTPEDGELSKTGYLPATTIRGKLRRAYVFENMKEAAAQNEHYPLKRVYAELIGQDPDSEKQAGEIDLIKIKETRDASPVLDLFGSGLSVASRLRVGHFFPSMNILPEEIGSIRKDLDETEEVVEALAPEDLQRFYERKDLTSRRSQAAALVTSLERKIRAVKKTSGLTNELEVELKEAEGLVEKYNQGMGDMQVGAKQLPTYFALPPGLILSGRIVIVNAKDHDLAIIEKGLNCMSLSPVLGAQSARGCGEIEGSFDVQIDGKTVKKITIGGYKSSRIDVF